jgi:hypothetical protein
MEALFVLVADRINNDESNTAKGSQLSFTSHTLFAVGTQYLLGSE